MKLCKAKSIALVFVLCSSLSSANDSTETLFATLSPEQSGVDFTNPIDDTHPKNFLYASVFATGSVTVADFNGDSRPDLFFCGGPVPNALYLQTGTDGKLHFTKITCGVESPDRWSSGASAVDIDSDGDLDLYVCHYDEPNRLFINQGMEDDGKLSFTEEAENFGLNISDASLTPAFADFDRDGDLDLFLLTNQFILEKGRPPYMPARLVNGEIVIEKEWQRYFVGSVSPDGSHKLDLSGSPDRLYRNDGKDGFADVTKSSGIEGRTFGLSTAWIDFDHDGWLDIYVASDFETPDRIWRNNQDGTFREVSSQVVPYCSWSSMGLGVSDFDNNGLLDLLVADMGGSTHFKSKIGMGVLDDARRHLLTFGIPQQTMRNCLFLDTGMGRFREAAYLTGLAKTDWTWSCKAGDFDNDGRVDVFFTNGIARNFANSDLVYGPVESMGVSEWDYYKHLPPYKETNRAFQNQGDLKFKNRSSDWGLDHLGMSYGAATADLDLDGDLDLITCNLDEPVQVLRNIQKENHGLLIELSGPKENPRGIGAQVRLTLNDKGTQTRAIQPAAGCLSFDSTRIHFGLGKKKSAKLVTITWPDGSEQIVHNLESGKLHLIKKESKPGSTPDLDASMFQPSKKGPRFTHRENSFEDFDEFRLQPLLPIRLSRSGGGMAWSDIDGDGDQDVYLGGANQQSGELHLNEGKGTFRKIEGPWSQDEESEDTGIVWLDADRDGDLDLFVASGGPEFSNRSRKLSDRLYLNNGDLTFVKAGKEIIPSFGRSSSSVSAADFDRDGDLDLFIGSRSIPGQYPRIPASRLLRNDGVDGSAKFTDVTKESADQLQHPGMITSSCWSDLDDNGWPDLILAVDYGPVRVFLNDEGKLRESTAVCGLEGKLGWWNSVTSADLDGDGRLDLIVGNDGLNTKYGRLSETNTVGIYYGEMDDSGIPRIIETKFSKERPEPLPVRGKG